MKLQLNRPLAFIDLETTGLNISTDRIIEIAIVKILPNGERIVKHKLINPEMDIPAAATAVHGITNEKVKDMPTFRQIANEIKQFLDNADLGGFNSNRFDIPMLMEEFLRVGIDFPMDDRKMLDAQKVFHMMEQRTLIAAYKFYCDCHLEEAHSARADAEATCEVLLAQIERYENIGTTVESIVKFTGEDNFVDFSRRFIMQDGIETFNFGKHKGRAVVEVLKAEPQYYDWMMKSDFSLHTKKKLTEIFNRTFLKKVL